MMKRCLLRRYLKLYRENLRLKTSRIDPLQHYYYKQRVDELNGLIGYYNDKDFMKAYREERQYAIELEEQNQWLINHYETTLGNLMEEYLRVRTKGKERHNEYK